MGTIKSKKKNTSDGAVVSTKAPKCKVEFNFRQITSDEIKASRIDSYAYLI